MVFNRLLFFNNCRYFFYTRTRIGKIYHRRDIANAREKYPDGQTHSVIQPVRNGGQQMESKELTNHKNQNRSFSYSINVYCHTFQCSKLHKKIVTGITRILDALYKLRFSIFLGHLSHSGDLLLWVGI